jgi:glycogen(starch) synthase
VSRRPTIALVSRELYPFTGGGLGNYVNWTAAALASVAEVTVLTAAAYERAYRRLRAAGDPRLPQAVRFEFIQEPDLERFGSFLGPFHLWSARALEAIERAFPGGGPDLIEFPDYHGEAAVSLQARRTSDPRLRNSLVAVRLNTTAEICHLLDGYLGSELTDRAMYELERYSLRYADRLIWPGGDVLATYRRYYGNSALAPAIRIPHAVSTTGERPPRPAPDGGPTRFLYVGRFERRKGVKNLLDALLGLERDDWRLTLIGADTHTGPLAVSIRRLLELTAAGDPRVEFRDQVPREELLQIVDSHHVCVIPSLWECWPNVALEAFERGRPVLATPTGGLVEMVWPDRSGWLTRGTAIEHLAAGLEAVLERRDSLAAITPDGPREAFGELTDPEPIRERYFELVEQAELAKRPDRRRRRPLVSVVFTYYELDAYLDEAVRSILSGTWSELELLIVNDGSLRERDAVLEEIAGRYPVSVVTQPNSGLPAARNLGIALSRGRYVLPFDADDVAEPELVERCVEALEADRDAVYAATWSRFMLEDGTLVDDGYRPLGNFAELVSEQNVAGAAASLIRREVFERGFAYDTELPSYEDWYLFRQLHEAGLYGHVIPEPLLRYRVRSDSMLRLVGAPEMKRYREEMDTRLRERAMEWVAPT